MTYRHLLTTSQVAELLGVQVSTVNRWAMAGLLESERWGTGRTAARFYDHDVVRRFGDELSELDS